MPGRQCYELLTPTTEERINTDDEPANLQLGEHWESSVNVALASSLQDVQLHLIRPCCFLYFADDALGALIVRVDEQGDHLSLGE